MTSRDEMLQTIMRAYKAREEGNIEGLMAAFHPHAVFELKGDKSMLEVAGAVGSDLTPMDSQAGRMRVFRVCRTCRTPSYFPVI
jgi:hypothetical protein